MEIFFRIIKYGWDKFATLEIIYNHINNENNFKTNHHAVCSNGYYSLQCHSRQQLES